MKKQCESVLHPNAGNTSASELNVKTKGPFDPAKRFHLSGSKWMNFPTWQVEEFPVSSVSADSGFCLCISSILENFLRSFGFQF